MAITVPVSAPKVYDPQGVQHYPEGTSQTFKTGDLLKLSSAALVPAEADDGGLLIAAQDATGTAGTLIACYKLTASTEIEIGVASTTAVAVGTAYGFALASGSTIAQLDGTETIATRFAVTRINLLPAGKYGVVGTDTNARVIVRPVAGATDTNFVGI